MKPDGTKFYECALCYIDNVCMQMLEPMKLMDYLRQMYTLKEGSVKEPDTYLGADIGLYELANGTKQGVVNFLLLLTSNVPLKKWKESLLWQDSA